MFEPKGRKFFRGARVICSGQGGDSGNSRLWHFFHPLRLQRPVCSSTSLFALIGQNDVLNIIFEMIWATVARIKGGPGFNPR